MKNYKICEIDDLKEIEILKIIVYFFVKLGKYLHQFFNNLFIVLCCFIYSNYRLLIFLKIFIRHFQIDLNKKAHFNELIYFFQSIQWQPLS